MMNNTLKELVTLSQYAAKPFWVQGAGGNTSVKDDEGKLWIKASGTLLSEVNEQAGWVQLDRQQVAAALEDESISGREPAGVEEINNRVGHALTATAAAGLRPSMETGFHSLYQRYVLHTHNAFANIFLCSDHAEDIRDCLPDPEKVYSSLLGDYCTPGAELSWMLYDAYRFRSAMPQLTLLPNHGIIVCADNLPELMKIHDAFNEKLYNRLGLTEKDYPAYEIREHGEGFMLDCAYMQDYFEQAGGSPNIFSEYITPDQVVYLYPGYFSGTDKTAKVFFDAGAKIIHLNAGRREALTIAELAINTAFLFDQMRKRGFEPLTINYDADKLRNMGAEKYRRKNIQE